MLNQIGSARWIVVALIALCPALLFADAGQPTTAPTSQPTLIAHAPTASFAPGSWPPRVIFGRSVAIPIPGGLNMGQFMMGSASEWGFVPTDQALFFAVQIYDLSGPADSLSADQLAPAAVDQLRARWGELVADDAPIQVQHDSKYALELRYSMHLCHGIVPLVDRYANVGKDLMRVTIIPMSQSLTPEQIATLSAAADKTSATIISTAKTYNGSAEGLHKESSTPQRTKPSAMPAGNVAPANPAAAAAITRKPGKET
jgi:hypothetical protein